MVFRKTDGRLFVLLLYTMLRNGPVHFRRPAGVEVTQPLVSDRGQVMQALARESARQPAGEGLRLRTGSGWVYLTPIARR